MASSAGAVSPSEPRSVPGSRASTPSPHFFGDNPAVAVGTDGTAAVAFSHLAPARRLDTPARIQDAFDRRAVLVAVRRPGGHWLRTQTVSQPGAARPQVVVDARGGVLVVWLAPACGRRPQPPGGCATVLGGLHARSLSSTGRWGPIVTLARNAADVFEGPPPLSVALDARGAATIAYTGGRPRKGPVSAQRVVYGAYAVQRRAGGRFGRPRLLPKLRGELVAAMDDTGYAYVAGTRAEAGENRPAVYVSARGRTGGWNTGSRVSAIPGSKPRIAVASDGAVVLAWVGARLESDHLEYGPVLAALAKPGARRFSAPTQISDPGNTRGVHIVAGSAGETLLSWSDSPEFGQSGRGLSYAVRPAGGDFGSPQTVAGTRPGQTIDDGGVVMLRGRIGLWFSQHPFGARAGLLLSSRTPNGNFSSSRALANERWRHAAAASSSSIAAAVGQRERVLRIITVRP